MLNLDHYISQLKKGPAVLLFVSQNPATYRRSVNALHQVGAIGVIVRIRDLFIWGVEEALGTPQDVQHCKKIGHYKGYLASY